jgi:hypothetical protein
VTDDGETCRSVGVLDISVVFRAYLTLFFISVSDSIPSFAESGALGLLLLLLLPLFYLSVYECLGIPICSFAWLLVYSIN